MIEANGDRLESVGDAVDGSNEVKLKCLSCHTRRWVIQFVSGRDVWTVLIVPRVE